MDLTNKALKRYQEKKADFIPPLIPETYYGVGELPEDASITDRLRNIGKSWVGGVGGKVKGMVLGGAAGGLTGLFNPFRSRHISPAGRSWRALLDVLAYGTAGAALGGTAGRLAGAREGARPIIEQPENVYDLRS